MTVDGTKAALARLLGDMQPKALDARRVAGMLDQPGCARRQLLDAATVPIDRLATILGCPHAGQSPFAITRGNAFEARVFDNGMAELISLARRHLGHDLAAVHQVDLSAEQLSEAFGKVDNTLRVAETRRHLNAMLSDTPGARQLLRHPMTTLKVGGITAYLEADALSYLVGGQLTTVEIKSFSAIGGVPDPHKTAAALTQSAVYILSLQETAAELGFDTSCVSTRVLLILTRDFSLAPIGFVRDVAPTVRRLRRRLSTLPPTHELIALIHPDVSLPAPPSRRSTDEERNEIRRAAADVVSSLPCRFGDGCVSCPLFRYCRDEARAANAVTAVGSSAVEVCGDIDNVPTALGLADGTIAPTSTAQKAVAEHLGRASRIAQRRAAAGSRTTVS